MAEGRFKFVAECARFNGEVAAYLDGEANPFVPSHSRECAPCRALLGDLQSILQAARELPLEEPSRAVWSNVRARLGAEGAFIRPACLRFAEELAAYLEGEARPFVVSHSQDCTSCGAALADVQLVCQAAHDLPQEEPSTVVWANVRAQLDAEGVFRMAPCRQFAAALAAYLEGEANPFIASHARECMACGAALADLQSIRQAARDLPMEEPSPVVWANVRAQLEAGGAFGTPVRGWRQILAWRWVPQAVPLGVLAALILVGSILTLPSAGVQWRGSAEEMASAPPVAQTASLAPLEEDSTLARVATDLERSFRANEASMAPDLKATYEKSLVSLDGSIEECLDSLRREPRNALAHEYLVTAYTRKAEILSSALEFDGR